MSGLAVASSDFAFSMSAKFKVFQGDSAPAEKVISNTATIGRTPDNTIVLPGSHVSRQHAIVRCYNAFQYQIMDLGSRNGTFVNDRRVITPVVLDPGSRVRIAEYELFFEPLPDEETTDLSDATLAAASYDTTHSILSAAMLVCDIRGFSTMSERLGERELARIVGNWFRDIGNTVQSSSGVIDKYIGDAVLAYWPTCDKRGTECTTCLSTALTIRELATRRQWPAGEAFRIVLALHFGRVTSSNVGQMAVRDATILGDAVNTVFRLEGIAKELSQELICSQDFVTILPPGPEFVSFGEFQLKGKSQLVGVYGLNR
jgi:adenylate cyclase